MNVTLFFAFVAWVVLVSCGPNGYDDGTSPEPTPSPTVTQPPAVLTWAQIQPLVQANCGRCHGVSVMAPLFTSAATFKTAAVLQAIQSGGMPKDGKISAADKATLITYLKS